MTGVAPHGRTISAQRAIIAPLLVLLLGLGAGHAAGEGSNLLAAVEARFAPGQPPVAMEYDIGYRFLNIELADVGRVVVTTTVGEWRHRVTDQLVPALLMDVQIDSPDNGQPGQRRRVSLHDRILAVLTVPDLQALVFARLTDQHLNPLIGRTKDNHLVSIYDTQSGALTFTQTDLIKGTTTTNLANPEALLELSRRVGPLMAQLVQKCRYPEAAPADEEPPRIGVNMDGKVVALRFKTYAQRSPACLGRQRFPTLCVTTEAERGSDVKPRDFHAWSVPFDQLAGWQADSALAEAVRVAPVESIVPLVLDYELSLGAVRATLTAVRAGATVAAPATADAARARPAAGVL